MPGVQMMSIEFCHKGLIVSFVVFSGFQAVFAGGMRPVIPGSDEIAYVESVAATGEVATAIRIAKSFYPGFCLNLPAATNDENMVKFHRVISAMLARKPFPTDDVVAWHRDARLLYSAVRSIPSCYRIDSTFGLSLVARELRWSEPYAGVAGVNEMTVQGYNDYKRYYREAVLSVFSIQLRSYFNSLPASNQVLAVSNFLATSSMTREEFDALMRPEDSADAVPPPSH